MPEPVPAPSGCLPLAPPPLRGWLAGWLQLTDSLCRLAQRLRDAPTTGQTSRKVKGARPGLRRRLIFNSSVMFSKRKSPELHLSPRGEKPAFLQLFENPPAVNQSRPSTVPGSWGLGHPRGRSLGGCGPGWRRLRRAGRGWRGGDQIPQFSSFGPTSRP